MSQRHIVIIGGGIIGLACADEFSRTGWQVTVVDKGEIGKGCSHGNCGLVCPSHVLPLAEPGAVLKTVKALFQSHSPFRVKPRFDLALWSWFWQFTKRCNTCDRLASAASCHALLQSSMNLYRDLMSRETFDCDWETHGLLFVYQHRHEMEAFAPIDRLLKDQFQLAAKRLTGDELVEFDASLKSGLAGGWFYPDDAHVRSDRLIAGWRTSLKSRGVQMLEHHEFDRFIGESSGHISGISTTKGADLVGNQFVIATGAWTGLLNRALRTRLPIQPGKGYSLTVPRPENAPRVPMLFPEHKVAATPWRSGFRLGSIMEFAGFDATLSPTRMQLLRDGAKPYLHTPIPEQPDEEWFGWRPMTYDSLPIIDRLPCFKNVWIAAGHNMLGLSMAPATGKLLRELVEQKPPHIDPGPYRASRFA
ncbi:MAG: FAD-dependent oxidoreductase [Planctomycetota bacterium]|nr:FAD-dependent oxidoreductase [Planctomycetota bacterium]MDA1213236.1 FAD-dependent oxidoreductase [Planctomycetota bacterium]